jgi:hypothetical protein
MSVQGQPAAAQSGVTDKAAAPARDHQQEWRLSPAWRKPLLVVHLSGAFGFLGSSLAVLALTAAGASGTAAATMYPAAQMITTWLVIPLAIVAFAAGVTQALVSPWGLTKYWWVAIKLLITAVVTIFIGLTIYPRIAGAAATALGHSTQPLTGGQRSRILSSWPIICGLLIINAFLGVYKPGWRLRKGQRSPDVSGPGR